MRLHFHLLAGLMLLIASAPLSGAADPFEQALTYTFDQPRDAVMAIEAQIRSASPEQLRAIEEKLIAILQSPKATSDGKAWACRQLRQAGSIKSVPALRPLLADKALATPALIALRSIPGPQVDEALRSALGEVPADLKIGIVQTIGVRGDRLAVALLRPLAVGSHHGLARSAQYALAQIGGEEATTALLDIKPQDKGEAHWRLCVMRCADSLVAEGAPDRAFGIYQRIFNQVSDAAIRGVALRGMMLANKSKALPLVQSAMSEPAPLGLLATRIACDLGGAEMMAAILKTLPTLAPDCQALVLDLAADRNAISAILAGIGSADTEVRMAAMRAMAKLGDASCLPALLNAAASATGPEQQSARKALRDFRAKDVDRALTAAAKDGQPAQRVPAIGALAGRGAASAVPVLLELTSDAEAGVRTEALAALGTLAGTDAVSPLLKRMVFPVDPSDRAAIGAAIVAISQRAPDRESVAAQLASAMRGGADGIRLPLLNTLAKVHTTTALNVLREAAGDANAAIVDAAVRGLADWPEFAAADDLLRIAGSGASPAHKVLALRGYVRLTSRVDSIPPENRAALLKPAIELAQRPEERKLVLAALGDVGSPIALNMAIPCLSDPQTEMEAALAVSKIAKAIARSHPQAAAAAMQRIRETCKSPAAKKLAQPLAIVPADMENIAPRGKASSPDGLSADGQSGGDQAAIDNKPGTYWDKQDNRELYRLVVTFDQPEKIDMLSIMGYQHHSFAPRDFDILCDGKVIKKVAAAQYTENLLIVPLGEVTAKTVELKITGYYGGSPAIRELGLYRKKQ